MSQDPLTQMSHKNEPRSLQQAKLISSKSSSCLLVQVLKKSGLILPDFQHGFWILIRSDTWVTISLLYLTYLTQILFKHRIPSLGRKKKEVSYDTGALISVIIGISTG